MKIQKYIVEIEMPDGDYIGTSFIQDAIQDMCDIDDEGRDRVTVKEITED